jgi:hypothetical protein
MARVGLFRQTKKKKERKKRENNLGSYCSPLSYECSFIKNFHCRIYKQNSSARMLTEINKFHSFSFYVFNIHLNIIIQSKD